MAKLKDILSEAFEDRPQIDKYKVVEGVKNFGIVGKQLYNNNKKWQERHARLSVVFGWFLRS